jgi:hypothetical protein
MTAAPAPAPFAVAYQDNSGDTISLCDFAANLRCRLVQHVWVRSAMAHKLVPGGKEARRRIGKASRTIGPSSGTLGTRRRCGLNAAQKREIAIPRSGAVVVLAGR